MSPHAEVIEAGPTGSFGEMMQTLDSNSSHAVVGGQHAAAAPAHDDRPLDELTKAELHEEAASLGLDVPQSAKKQELVDAISDRYDEIEAEGAAPASESDSPADADEE